MDYPDRRPPPLRPDPRPMRALLLLTLLTPLLAAQTRFEDPTFDFSFDVPEGMTRLSDAELIRFMQLPEDTEVNPDLGPEEAPSLSHHFLWRDETGQGREVRLLLNRVAEGLPFTDPQTFAQAMTEQWGLTVQSEDQPQMPRPRFVLTGTRRAANGTELNLTASYLLMGRNTYGLLTTQGLTADWAALEPVFRACHDSATYPPPSMGGPGDAASEQGAAAAAVAGARASGPANAGPAERWDSLQVTGSLVLAALLLMSLFVAGGKR